MNTANIFLMVILSAMIGFAIGNIWGKETMKRTMQELLNQIISGMKTVSNKKEEKRGE